MLNQLKHLWHWVTTVHTPDPEVARRGKILAQVLAVTVLGGLLLITVNVIFFVDKAVDTAFYAVITTCCVGFFWLNRAKAPQLSAVIFLSLLVLAIAISDEPALVIGGRTTVAMILPIIIAAFTITPAAAFAFLAFVLLALSVLAIPILTSTVIFMMSVSSVVMLLVALVSFLAASSMEQALRGEAAKSTELEKTNKQLDAAYTELAEAHGALQKLNTKLDQRVKERTADLKLAVDVSGALAVSSRDFNLLLQNAAMWFEALLDSPIGIALVKTDSGQLELVNAGEMTLPPELQAAAEAMVRGDGNPAIALPEEAALVPLRVANKTLGVLVAPNGAKRRAALEAVAGGLAAGIENAALYQELQTNLANTRLSEEARANFMRAMSHELRTPLNAIMGNVSTYEVFAEVGQWPDPLTQFCEAHGFPLEALDTPDNALVMLARELNPMFDPLLDIARAASQNRAALLEVFSVIYGSAEHLLSLINDIMDYSKMEAGKLTLFIETFDPAQITIEAVRALLPNAEKKGLSLTTALAPALPPSIAADKKRVMQVIYNLLSNAIKFTEKGAVVVGLEQQGESVRFWVKDTGAGIPPAKQAGMFEAFTQLDNSATRKAGGTGLGLPISRQLAEMHGGRLWVESTGVEGDGSTFYFEVPIENQAREATRLQLSTAAAKLGPVNILLVEDSPDDMLFVKRVFPEGRYTFHWAMTCALAMEMAHSITPDLIVLDLLLPDGDGLGLYAQLRQIEHLRAVPVMVVSARDLTPEDVNRLNGGLAGAFQKGRYQAGELVGQVEKLFGGPQ